MTPIWPEELPRPRRDGYARTLADGRLATKNDAGPPRVRRRFSAAPSAMQMTMDLTLDLRMRFFRFWEEETSFGTLPFWIPDWTTDGVPLTDETGAPLLTADGQPILVEAWHLVMFGTDQAPSEGLVGITHRLSFPLSILP